MDPKFEAILLEGNPDALILTDPEGQVVQWNRGAEEVFGYPGNEAVGSLLEALVVPPERVEEGRQLLAEAIALGSATCESVRRRKDGTPIYVDISARGVRAGADPVQYVLHSAKDVTGLKVIRDAKLLEAQFRDLLESTPDGIVIAGEAGRILLANGHAEQLFGYGHGELRGKPVELLLPERFRHAHVGHRSSYFNQPRTRSMGAGLELFGLRKDGREFPVEISLSPLKSGDGMLAMSAIRDITERKRIEQVLCDKNIELQNAAQAKNRFLANMSHELRTPLNGIIGFAELMANGKVGPVSPRHQEYLEDILASARHLHQLINDVLDLAKVEAGKLEFRPEPFDLGKLVDEVRDVLHAVAANKRIQVATEVDGSLSGLVGDAAKIKQILYNFLSNGLKFTAEDGRIRIGCRPEGAGSFRIDVEDTGIGIKAEDLGRLFVEFQQLDASTTKHYPGTGLGLALTKRLVEAYGGEVKVRSTPGVGSVFTAVLPRVFSPAGPEPAPRPRAPEPASLLVVENAADERRWLADILGAEGYRVEAVSTGAEAIAACGRRAFSALTLDILLPDMSGWEALSAIRKTAVNPAMKVVVVTRAPGGGAGTGFVVDDILIKPVDEEELIGALRRAGVPSASGTVLIVEDDSTMRKLACLAIESMGLQALATADGAEALGWAAGQRPEALVVDLLLPGMSGFEFLLRLRREPWGRGIPVIVWTAKTLSGAERARLMESAQVVIGKSDASLEGLLRAIKEQCHPAQEQGVRHGG